MSKCGARSRITAKPAEPFDDAPYSVRISMAVPGIIQSIESSGIAEWMRLSVKAMPIVESIHVLAAATVFGTIFIVDLRLLGFPGVSRPFTRVSDEMLRLTWVAFLIAA